MRTRQKRLAEYFTKNSWRDRKGEVIEALPFSLRLPTVGLQRRKNYTSDEAYAWPPKNWAQVQGLAATLQYAHLWVALMAMAGRHGEMLSLQRDCVEFHGMVRLTRTARRTSSVVDWTGKSGSGSYRTLR